MRIFLENECRLEAAGTLLFGAVEQRVAEERLRGREGIVVQRIEQFHGRARFVGPATLAVGDDRLTGRHVLIAAGAIPAPLKFAGAERLTTSEQYMNLDRLPASLAFVGGGYISFEFAHVAARAGAEVTILHRGARPLEGFDPDLVDLLLKRSRELGIKIELGVDVLGVDSARDRLVVRVNPEPPKEPAKKGRPAAKST